MIFRVLTALIAVGIASSAFAEVSAEEAKQLGGATLTAWGAEKAGNKDGSIPEYTGVSLNPPATWNPKEPGRRPDPFNEKPLFSITAANAAQHATRLTEGSKALFKQYPGFRMDIYPSHRTVVFPKYVLDNTLKNATGCRTKNSELSVEGCYGGVPFPIPKSGNQVMWNHLLEYENLTMGSVLRSWVVPATGAPVMVGETLSSQEAPYFDPNRTTAWSSDALYWQVRNDNTAPARTVGQKLVVIDPIDPITVGRRAWQYIPGQRRVKLAPDLAYDTPTPYTAGISTMDDVKGFAGALDRYDFKLVGKFEKYIPYNSFKLTDYQVCPEAKVFGSKNYPDPDCVRWELHRTWVVEANLKPGFRHIYKKRLFYWDEDGYLAGTADSFDAGGKLYRTVWLAFYPYWEGKSGGGNGGTSYIMDLQTGMWTGLATSHAQGLGMWPMEQRKPGVFYSPEALAGEGIR